MFKEVLNDKEYEDVRAIRDAVFIQEQGVSPDEEYDDNETHAHYIIGYNDAGDPIATARYRGVEEIAKIERVAVMKDYRGQGIGKELIQFLEQLAIKHGFSHFKLGAQIQAIPFYETLGYEAYGDIFMDANIPHRYMKKSIN
ncbi:MULTISPECIES: GNAT family N-acetyltransferase [unclassified Staphylococcus]|uniref:GNAT family N-acetyltransferase n=1 Tax=unclassified Staphylococcus TaxID=91994 RepID=UPI0021D3A181|nr:MULTISPECIES: GNAT family N-acetyltransferase [unclassified Staphylococcus]UXR70162.1 GNAT family N-acetyltransferase [Staphylococcus sp. IVB6246]UXR72222.1 GNAT family N-acetyltransferase [Staphylococcus sp. IVB6240]UXR74531.1 GNAT family N-acetyltransferase [Staphylococcus sp. IVB6238]UXR76915.1 GNAT family N-acetyltransferase [Staphylococcus sp. IVB6233]UXR81041.1 GNAT family N-acetyltransferase [Staphylococcus sp. IVB6218]